MITIVQYGMGNLGSILNMLKYIGAEARVSSDPEDIASATKLILPGVGAFDIAMQHLERSGLIPHLERKVLGDRAPILGICLGMQLLGKGSEEGVRPGLGWLDATAVRFQQPIDGGKVRVPHMGWNVVRPQRGSELLHEMPAEPRFYFVHSFHVVCADANDVLTRTPYAGIDFVSGVQKDNIGAFQFHPEKSHRFGMRLLTNFVGRF